MAQTHDFERAFGFVLHEAARLLSKRFDQKARAIGLTRAQCSLLFRLSMQEGMNQARLAELMEMEPISLARLLDRMEQAGWVERRADPADKRAYRLYMTAKAKPVLERMLAVGLETRGEALAGISQADRDRMIDLLIQVRRNLSERGGEPQRDHTGARA
ncbi:MAG TPA: MarR family transcriptional regulator [Stellaceae bacterium]|jgi:MarR family transcriptional regulator, transcriptional regulator for hemolysin|nr:MarR family transcriptional regulator [Stellaceae bacterium]